MKKTIFSIIFSFFLLVLFVSPTLAYTVKDVSTHNKANNCWMIYDNGVYNITSYVTQHDENLDIRSWCGKDITKDFQTKDGTGVDHKQSSYNLLAQYKIGNIEKTVVTTPPVTSTTTPEEDVVVDTLPTVVDTTNTAVDTVQSKVPKEYNLIIPLLATLLLYWVSYFLVKKNKFFGINIMKFNAFWNTLLFLTLLIPAFGFGVFMLIRIQKPSLMNIAFDFKYWHVELSIVMGVLGFSHLIQRLTIYLRQLNLKK